MKFSRQYLFGVGSGLILSALISLLFMMTTPESLGTVGVDIPQKSSADTIVPEEKVPAENSSTEEAQTKAQTQTQTQAQTQAQTQTQTQTQAQAQAQTQTQKSFEIPRGASAEKIAQLLQNEGWIQNKEEFLTKVKAQNLEKRFKAGTYKLTPGLSTDNIIQQLLQ